jgi:hypothetical protein
MPRATRRRLAARALLRPTLVAGCLVVMYFALPMDKPFTAATGLALAAGLVLIAAILTWQVRAIASAPYPRLRAIEALATSFALFIVLFATVYYALGRSEPGSFTEPITRLDALYFTITVFATVGFGDIAPRTPPARIVTIVQMLGDLVLVGMVAHLIVNAVRVGLDRQASRTADSAGGGR